MRIWPFNRERRIRGLESPAVPLSTINLSDWSLDAPRGGTERGALSIPAVWAAVDLISSELAELPLHVYRRRPDGSRERTDGPYKRMLNSAPNPAQSAFDLRAYLWQRVLLYGRGFLILARHRAGTPAELWAPDPRCMQVERIDGRIVYTLYDSEGREAPGKRIPAADVVDVCWMPDPDGVHHYCPVRVMEKTLSQGIGAIEYARRFFSRGGMPHFLLTTAAMDANSLTRARMDVAAALENIGREGSQVMALPNNADLKPVSATPEQTQFLEAQRFTVEQVSRMYGIPPPMLQDFRRGTYANVEQSDLHLVKHTLSRWAARLEQQLNLKLFGARSERLYVEHSMAGVLRGDLKARAEALGRQIQTGQLTPNEARELENRPPMDGGDDLMIQGATVPLKKQGEPKPAPAFPPPGDPAGDADGDEPGGDDDGE